MPATANQAAIKPRTLKIPLTNVYAKGGYSAQLTIGANQDTVNLILDTGSSTLVISGSDYNEQQDKALNPTSFAQEVLYGIGGWDGPVVHTRVGICENAIDWDLHDDYHEHAHNPVVLESCPVAVVYCNAQETTFAQADGILGLAYHALNKSYNLKPYFEQYKINPALTHPWPFDDEIALDPKDFTPIINSDVDTENSTDGQCDCTPDTTSQTKPENQHKADADSKQNSATEPFTSHDLRKFKQFLNQQPCQDVVPYFTELTQHGLTANKFAFYCRRSSIHVNQQLANCNNAIDTSSTNTNAAQHADHFEQLGQDPLNQGWLILGGGEEHTELYQGDFATISVVEDKYYNVNLIALQVGDNEEIDSQLTNELEDQLDQADADSQGDTPSDSDNHSDNHSESQLDNHANSHSHSHTHGVSFSPAARGRSNAIIDTGASAIVLTRYLFNAMVEQLHAINPKFTEQIAPFKAVSQQFVGMNMDELDLSAWPTLTFRFVGIGVDDSPQAVDITVAPKDYWQLNTPSAGKACFKILSQFPNWPNQSILGLPLMSNYYVVFDRSAHENGVIRFAKQAVKSVQSDNAADNSKATN
ncbi:pepsin-like aspartyl protease [Shewanella waksmanii]|uniref:pepsin-like aspartyl protease n=1 Tax=Shewanella waksmanii TaxID=213783 RepID=UPI0037353AE7